MISDYANFTHHALTKIGDDEVLHRALLKALHNPQVRYEAKRGQGVSFKHISDGMAVVVGENGKVITFFRHKDETPLRPDQTDEDAIRHAATVAREQAAQARAHRDAKRAERKAKDRAATLAMKGKKA